MHEKGEEMSKKLIGVQNGEYVGVEGLMREIKKGGIWKEVEEKLRGSEEQFIAWVNEP